MRIMRSSTAQYSLPPPPPPPPPPPYAARKRRKGLWAVALVLIAIIVVASLFYSGIFLWPFKTQKEDVYKVTITSGTPVQVTSQSIDARGGTIEVTNSSSPLFGLEIEVPEASTSEVIDFTIRYADVTNITGLPKNCSVASKLIQIDTSGSDIWNEYKTFDLPVMVTLPYDPSLVTDDGLVRFYHYDPQYKILESTGFLWEDTTNHTVTFSTATFCFQLGILFPVLLFLDYLQQDFALETSFLPRADGWFLPNPGSYFTSEGFCFGMVNYAKWYYEEKVVTHWIDDPLIPVYEGGGCWDRRDGVVSLYSKYQEGDPNSWLDDATAIQLATRADCAAAPYLPGVYPMAPVGARLRSCYVAGTLLHNMYVTHMPQIVGLKTTRADGTTDDGGHAVLVYGYRSLRFDVYDPNYPGTYPGTREIPFTLTFGFPSNYTSGAVVYNVFLACGDGLFGPRSYYNDLFDAAEEKFVGNNRFPTIKLTDTSTTPLGTTPEDTNSDGIRDTDDTSCTVSGTITGDMPQGEKVNATWFLYPQTNVLRRVLVIDGSFTHKVPLLQGDNEIIIIASGWHNYRKKWAGVLRETIKCTATLANLTFTLNWDQDNSDVDLHVLEPTIAGIEGRHIYYRNKGVAGGLFPYLDMDNTRGGPHGDEHYIGTTDMTLPNYLESEISLYGTYKVRVHYYADHDDNPNQTQTITWHLTIKCIRFRVEETGKCIMLELAFHGSLSSASSSSTEDFFNSDPSWSKIEEVPFTKPDPRSIEIPPPPQNKLP